MNIGIIVVVVGNFQGRGSQLVKYSLIPPPPSESLAVKYNVQNILVPCSISKSHHATLFFLEQTMESLEPPSCMS